MSRTRHFIHSLASGYFALGMNVIYTMVSIPLALHYLSKEEFGLWAVVMQICTYLAFIDAGMTGSIYRLLIDHKDSRDGGEYGRILSTGLIVFSVQGAILALAGVCLNPLLAELLQIPPHVRTMFYWLNGLQCVIIGIGVATRTLSIPLMSHQRFDIANGIQSGQFLLQLGVLWWTFLAGWGIWGMLAAVSIGTIYSSSVGTWMAWRLRLLPTRTGWALPQWTVFKQIAGFGRDVFLLTIGWQLVLAAPVFIVARTLGLEAAATWTVCTKTFSLVQQLVWRILDFSAPGLTEMFVRGESERLKHRFREVVTVTASTAIITGGIAAACNSSFVQLWTKQKITWSGGNDIGLGLLVVVYSVTRCFMLFGGVTKQIGGLGYIYLTEAALLSVAGWWATISFGFGGLIVVSIIADLLCSGSFAFRQVERYFALPRFSVISCWLNGPWRLLVVFAVCTGAIGLIVVRLAVLPKFALGLVLTSIFGFAFFWFVGLPQSLRTELLTRFDRFRS